MTGVVQSRLDGSALLRPFAWTLIVSGILAVIASFILNLNRSHIGIALVASGVMSQALLSSGTPRRHTEPILRRRFNTIRRYGPAFILLLLAPTVWVITQRDDAAFFVVISVGATMIALPLLDAQSTPRAAISLGTIVLLHLELLWRMLQFSVGPIGVDPWFHASIIRGVAASGSIPPGAGPYVAFPLFHILGAQLVILLRVSPFVALIVLSGTMTVTPIFVFLASRQCFSLRVALLTALIFAASDYFLFWTVWLIPMGFGVVFFAMVVYSALSIPTRPWRVRVVLIIGVMATILLHPIVTIFTILGLVLFMLPRRTDDNSLRSRDALNLRLLPVVFAVAAFAWWTYSLGPGQVDVVTSIIVALGRVFATFSLGATVTVTSASSLPYSVVLGRDLGLTVMLAVFPVGLVAIGREPSVRFGDALRVALPAIGFMAFPFVVGVGGQALLLPDRWFVFGYLFATVAIAFLVASVRDRFGGQSGKVAASLIVALVVVVMISDPLGNAVQPLYGQAYQVSNYFTDAEIQAPAFLSHAPPDHQLVADGRYAALVIRDWYAFNGSLLPLTPGFTAANLTQSDILVVRSALRTEPVIVGRSSAITYYQNLPNTFWDSLYSSSVASRVYDDGGVSAYVGG